MNMTTTSVTQQNIKNTSNPFAPGAITNGKRSENWNADRATLNQPLHWRKPRRIFVCAHGDLFHESVPDAWIDRVFAVMALAPQHTFQALTKRPERASSYLSNDDTLLNIGCAAERIDWPALMNQKRFTLISHDEDRGCEAAPAIWPLPNVWLGTSIHDQASADLRIPHLLATPAAVRFISAEPLLGPVDLNKQGAMFALHTYRFQGLPDSRLDWVITGGESGKHARPAHPDWFRSLRDQCAAAGVAFHFKQWGEWAPGESVPADVSGHKPNATFGPFTDGANWAFGESNMSDPEADWQDEPDLYRIGKARAGRLLDGVEHNGMPGVQG